MSRTVHVSDPGIRLFGKTIHEFELGTSCCRGAASGARGDTTSSSSQEMKNKLPEDASSVRFPELKILVDQVCSKEGAEVVELVDYSLSPCPKEDAGPEIITPSSTDEVHICITNSRESDKPTENLDGEAADDKIPKEVADKKQHREKMIPCPRCNSTETKFCYFNNCSVNQPRHFCRKCQRYWTAGGSMRNIPVGAGRRKSKKRPEKNEEKEKNVENMCEPSSSCSGHSPISDPTMAEMNCVTMNYPSGGSMLPWAFYTFQPTDHWIDMNNGSVATFTDRDSGNLGKHSRDEAPSLWRSLAEESVSKMDKKFGLNLGKAISASNDGGLFKVINLETRWEIRHTDFSKVLFANPAALSRSMDFRECS